MAVTQWAPVQSHANGADVSPAVAVPAGAAWLYVRLDFTAAFDADTERVEYQTQWTPSAANNPNQIPEGSWQDLAGGGFVGGHPGPKTGDYSVVCPVPGGCQWMRAAYTVSGGPVSFGVSGEFRATPGA